MAGWSVLIAAHAAGATLALLLGAHVVLRRTKGDLLHRRVGRVWVVAMYGTAGSSFGIKELRPGHYSWIHGLSAWTVFTLTMAIWAAATHRVEMHRGFVVGTYAGLVGAGIAAVAFPTRLVPQTAMHAPWALLGVVVAVTAVAVAVIQLAARVPRRVRSGGAARAAHPA
jgi:uncharacterized membrane protein